MNGEGDPGAVTVTLQAAIEAFERGGTPEEGMTERDGEEAQLRKACRLIDAARTLRDNNGYYTAIVELSFGAIERSFEFYAIAVSNDEVQDFSAHETPYERGAHLGVISPDMRDDFLGLYYENRAPSYYSDRVVTAEEAEAMLDLAVTIHEFLRDHPRNHYDCLCEGT